MIWSPYTRPSLTRAFLTCGVACSAALALGACGKEDAEKAATVTITTVDPAAAYPNVDVTVSFTLEPGANTTAGDLSWTVDFGDGATAPGEGVEGSSKHAYTDSGTYTIKVRARAEGKTVGEATQEITIYSPVDLQASAVRGAPANVRTGDMLTVSAELKNGLATPILTPFSMSAALIPLNDPQADPIALGDGEIVSPGDGEPVIPSGDAVSRSITVSIPDTLDSGDYYVVVNADAKEVIADTDRSNNTAQSSGIVRIENISQTDPDLLVRDVLAAPDRAFPALSRVTRGLTVANNGGADIFNVVVKTYLSIGDDQFDPQTDQLIHTSEPISIITARTSKELLPETIVLDSEILPPAGGEVDVHVFVHAVSQDDGVVEANTDNNVSAAPKPIVVSDQLVEGPDLVVKSFTVTPENTFLDGTLDIKATITNEGTADVGSFLCGIYLGAEPKVNTALDPRVTNINITRLKSEETLEIERTITIPGLYDPGKYYMYMVCDPQGGLGETFRSNNQAIYPNVITITDQADVDLFVDSFDVPTTGAEGAELELTLNVCVGGANASGPTRAELFRTAGNRVDFNGTPFATIDIPNVNPEECAEVKIPYTPVCDQFQDRYSFGVVLDADDRLPEFDETNNVASSTQRLTVTGPFCACTEDSFEPNNRVLDAKGLPQGKTSAALCAQGTCDYYSVPLQIGDSLSVSNRFDYNRGVLATTLYAPGGLTVLDVDRAAVAEQQVSTFLVTQDGDYILAVCGELTTTRNLYELEIETLQQSPGIDIVARDLTVPAQATYSIGAQLDLTWRAYNLGQVLSPDFDARVVVSSNKTLGDVDDQVLNTINVTGLNAASSRQLTAQVVLPPSLVDGTYYLAVQLDPTNTLGDTDPANNVVWSGPIEVKTLCYDALEPNDSRTNPRTIPPASYNNIVACAQAKDYYEVCAQNGQKLDVKIQFNGMMYDLDVVLYDDQGNSLDTSSTTNSVEEVNVPYVNGAQCYTVEVSMTSLDPAAETTYSMDVTLQNVDPSLLCDSLFEPNDSFDRAASVLAAVGMQTALDRCPVTDTDFYYIDLARGQTVTLRGTKSPSNQGGVLRLQFYNTNRTPNATIETAPGIPVAELPSFTAPQAGRYYLQVTAGGNTRKVTYTLEAIGITGADLSPESFSIGPGTYKINDEIRFGFDLKNLGTDPSSNFADFELFVGTSATHDPMSDVSLGTYTIPTTIAGGATTPLFDRANVSPTIVPNAMQPHYLHLVVSDPIDVNTTNNIATTPIWIVP